LLPGFAPGLSLKTPVCFGTAKVRTFFEFAIFILTFFLPLELILFPFYRAAKVETFFVFTIFILTLFSPSKSNIALPFLRAAKVSRISIPPKTF